MLLDNCIMLGCMLAGCYRCACQLMLAIASYYFEDVMHCKEFVWARHWIRTPSLKPYLVA